jgi:hypothetical protein
MPAATTCAAASLAAGEALAATAPFARGWVLVEQKGAWGAKALTESGLDQRIGAELENRAKALGLKALLVKPPGRDPSRGRSLVLASSLPGACFVEELVLREPAEVLDLDLAPLADGRPTGAGRVSHEPLYLACTNGKRDACCARLGLPVARALSALAPGRVWECSHLGGHRFAANVVCLPDGLCYGRVRPERVTELVRAYEEGRVVLDLLRGRSALAPGAQAAEHALRERGLLAPAEVVALVESANGRATFETRAGRRLAVEVVSAPGPLRPASCGEEPEPSEQFEIVAIDEL